MLYKHYAEKTRRWALKLARLYRYRLPIIIALSIMIVTAAALTLGKGLVVADGSCPDEVEYGNSLSYSAKAFLGKTVSEYRPAAGGEWSRLEPTEVGEYQVRAVSHSAFGSPRYGQVHTYRIVPRTVTVAVPEGTLTYGDPAPITADLAYEHKLTVEVTYGTPYREDGWFMTAAPVADTLSIVDADGADMSANYAVTVAGATTLSLQPRSLTVDIVTDPERAYIYDGKPLRLGYIDYRVAEGSTLAAEDTLAPILHLNDDQALDAGVYTVDPEMHVLHQNGLDVTELYRIDYVDAEFEVEARPLFLKSESAEKPYDGVALDCYDVVVEPLLEDQGLLEGHTLHVTGGASLLDVGETENALAAGIEDASGRDVTHNYAPFWVLGTLKVVPCELTVTTGSATMEYNGEARMHTEYTLSAEKLAGHEYQADFQSDIYNVGKTENLMGLVILRDGKNVTANFAITYEYGILTMKPRPISVTTASAVFEYDGLPCGTKTPPILTYAGENPDEPAVPPSDRVEIGREVTVTNVSEGVVINAPELTFYGIAYGQNVTDNYEIVNADYGTLQVTPRPLVVRLQNVENYYDGTVQELAAFGNAYTFEYDGEATDRNALAHRQTLSVDLTGSTRFGTTNTTLSGVSFRDVEGNPVSADNYRIRYESADGSSHETIARGTMTILPRPITVTARSLTHLYDGTSHAEEYRHCILSSDIFAEDEILPVGHELVIDYNPERPTEVLRTGGEIGSYPNSIRSLAILQDGEDVTGCFAVDPHDGIVTILPRPLRVTAADGIWLYDGTEKSRPEILSPVWAEKPAGELWEEVTLSGACLLDGDRVETVIRSACTDVNRAVPAGADGMYPGYDNVIDSVTIRGADGTDVTANYEIETVSGTLTILPRPINVRSASGTWLYDGMEKSAPALLPIEWCAKPDGAQWQEIVFPTDCMVAGDRLDADLNTTCVHVAPNVMSGDSYSGYRNYIENIRITDRTGRDVTQNYEAVPIYGTLTILPRPIVLTSADQTWLYDGTEKSHPVLQSTAWDALPTGEQWQEITLTGDCLVDGDDLYAHMPTVCTHVRSSEEAVLGYENKITRVQITNRSGVDVTMNYRIQTMSGTLTILPRPITIRTASASKIYDGTPLTASGFTLAWDSEVDWSASPFSAAVNPPNTMRDSCLATGDKSTVVNNGTLTKVLWSEEENRAYGCDNTVGSYTIRNARGEDVRNDYRVRIITGTLTVTRRDLNIVTDSYHAVYDGEYHELISMNGVQAWLDAQLKVPHYARATNYTSYNTVDSALEAPLNIHDVLIINENGENVRSCFDIQIQYGTVVIEKRPVRLQIEDTEVIYDGMPHTGDKVTALPETDPDRGLLRGHSVTINFQDSATIPGTLILSYAKDSAEFKDIYAQTVTSSYEVEEVLPGTLTIKRRPITIVTGSQTRPANGSNDVLTYDYSELSEDSLPLVQGHHYTLTITGNQVGHGSSPNTFAPGSLRIEGPNGESVYNYYDPFIDEGTLTLGLDAAIHVTTDSAIKNYDGTGFTHESGKWDILDGEIPEGYTVILGGYAGHDGTAGQVVGNSAILTVLAPDGTDVTDQIKVTTDFGSLIVNPFVENPGELLGRVTLPEWGYTYLRGESYGDYVGGLVWSEAKPYSGVLLDKNGKRLPLNALAGLYLANHGEGKQYTVTFEDMTIAAFPYYIFNSIGLTDDTGNLAATPPKGSLTFVSPPDELRWILSFLINDEMPDYTEEERAYRAYVAEHYLGVDEETRAYLQTIIDSEGLNSMNRYQQITSVVDILNSLCKANVNYDDRMDLSDNVVLTFLQEEQKGNARHFSAAAVMMYRALGIPARVVDGYRLNAHYTDEVVDLIAGEQEYTWVEVYMDGLGWIMVDPVKPQEEMEFLNLKPIAVSKQYDGMPLYAENRLYETGLLGELLAMGYTYEVQVEGEQIQLGVGESRVVDFKLLDPEGNDVTEAFYQNREKGTITISDAVIDVVVFTRHMEYGNVITFGDEDGDGFFHEHYVILTSGCDVDIRFNIRVENTWESITLADLNEGRGVYYTVTVIKDGRDISETAEIRFMDLEHYESYDPAVGLDPNLQAEIMVAEITPREIELQPVSKTVEFYEDGILTAENFVIIKGSLLTGDLLIKEAILYIYDDESNNLPEDDEDIAYTDDPLDAVGIRRVLVKEDSIVIYNTAGLNVTENYLITRTPGTLIFTEPA